MKVGVLRAYSAGDFTALANIQYSGTRNTRTKTVMVRPSTVKYRPRWRCRSTVEISVRVAGLVPASRRLRRDATGAGVAPVIGACGGAVSVIGSPSVRGPGEPQIERREGAQHDEEQHAHRGRQAEV